MLDAFWFAKRAGSEGTSVTQLAGGANLGELSDLMYFVKKLYKALKVPTNRLEAESTLTDSSAMLREELKFAKFIVRLQQHFAAGLKLGFITHLKMLGVWKDLDIRESDLKIAFNPPSNFYELREAQKLGIKAENYANLSQSEMISPTYCQKKYLGWDDRDVLANRQYMRLDREFNWELAQIEAMGPGWKEQLEAATAAAAAPVESGGDIAGDFGGGGGAPPEFGGGPADVGVEGEVPEAPELDTDIETPEEPAE